VTAWIFVLAIYNHTAHELRFHHKVVLASSSEEAYDVGSNAAFDSDLLPVAEDESANDYVIKLVEE
jgi:hypothetical protein